jgi:putative flippase GtrA
MRLHPQSRAEALTAAKFAAVSLMGFAIDAALLKLGTGLGLSPLAGRAVSLVCAMQATFLVNGLLVFRCLTFSRCGRLWLGYMAASSFGNLCNYGIFAALVVSRAPLVSLSLVALTLGSMSAYCINYTVVRLLVFGRPKERAARASSQRGPAASPASSLTA